MFEINALDHIALSVRDVARSAQWYAEVLGFKRLHENKWNGILVFVGNPTESHLNCGSGATTTNTSVGTHRIDTASSGATGKVCLCSP
jgi:catechol 2,3-dioxygenase-like lactoylglutathione lyase family enzyme